MANSKILVALTLLLAANPASQLHGDEPVSYRAQIKPLLARKCIPCHGSLKQESDLRLDTASLIISAGMVIPGSPESSEVMRRITAIDTEIRMPPEGEPLSPSEQELVKQWISQGATGANDEQPQPDPSKHWAFQPISSPELPNNLNVHPIDYFISQRLNAAGLALSPRADALSICRRLFLDLHGLPPSPKQIAFFTEQIKKNDKTAIRELIDDLLSSPRYGERWAQHWLDLVRYADTHGFEVNTPRENAWPYRDYVIQAFNEDLPFDQFIREQIAGDQFGNDVATGFLVAAPVLLPGQIGKDDASIRLARQDSLDEIIVGTTASFLGLTVGCARCHDHKFDPISQEDYYSLQAFFAGVQYGERVYHDESDDQKQQEAAELSSEIERLQQSLTILTPQVFSGKTIIIDDENPDLTTSLATKNGHGTNPPGTNRGYKDDPGDLSRAGNLSFGRYTWWDNRSGEDVFTWNPNIDGDYRLWISWGVHGSGVHTRDARYVLDLDGDLETRDDQKEIAIADQYYFSGQTEGTSEQKPLWSGLHDTGVHRFQTDSRLVLRGGETGTGITADVIVLQEGIEGENQGPRLRAAVSAKLNRELFRPRKAKFVRFTTRETIDQNKHQPCIDELEIYSPEQPNDNLALASLGTKATSSGNYSETGKHQLKHVNDGVYGNSRSWISNEFGGGWVQLELPEETIINKIIWGRDRDEQFRDRLSVKYEISISSDGEKWETIASSNDRIPYGAPHDELNLLVSHIPDQDREELISKTKNLRSLEQRYDQLRKPSMVYAGTFTSPTATHLLHRGDPEQPKHEVKPRTPSIFDGIELKSDSSEATRRLMLADWIASEENPLTARVIANRVWQFHFGTGLVNTPSDFGMNGSKPSHPKLLDWLASELIQSSWSIHHLHRLILTSQTYQQDSKVDERAMAIDSNCRLLWRFPSRRIEAESIRDSILFVSGELNLKMGGPGFNFFQTRGGLSGFPPLEKQSANELRRTIYSHKIRMEPIPVFGAFDCPDAGQPSPSRGQSTTAIQALNLFNSELIHRRAIAFARRVTSELPNDIERQIERVYQLALGRIPTDTERASTTMVVREHGLETLCRVIFNCNEFLFMP